MSEKTLQETQESSEKSLQENQEMSEKSFEEGQWFDTFDLDQTPSNEDINVPEKEKSKKSFLSQRLADFNDEEMDNAKNEAKEKTSKGKRKIDFSDETPKRKMVSFNFQLIYSKLIQNNKTMIYF